MGQSMPEHQSIILARIAAVIRNVAGSCPPAEAPLIDWLPDSTSACDVIDALAVEFGQALSPDLLRLYGSCRELASRLGEGANGAPDVLEGSVAMNHAQHARLLRDAFTRRTGRAPFPRNVIVAWQLAPYVQLEDLDLAVRLVKTAHPTLRARFELQDGLASAWVDAASRDSGIVHLVGMRDVQQSLRSLADEPTELSEGTNRWYLLTDTHGMRHLACIVDHIVFDGYSVAVLERDLSAAVQNGRLAGVSRRSHFFAHAKQQDAVLRDRRDELRAAWESKLVNGRVAPTMNSLIVDDDAQGWDAASWSSTVDSQVWSKVQAEAADLKVTPFAVVLGRLLSALRDFVDGPRVGLYVAADGRTSRGHMETVGWYSSSLLVSVERESLRQGAAGRVAADALRSASSLSVPISWLIENFEPERHGNFSSPQVFFFVSYQREQHLEGQETDNPFFVRRHDVGSRHGYRGASMWLTQDTEGMSRATLSLGSGVTERGRVRLINAINSQLGTSLVPDDLS